jgi:hypothetical protein
MADRIKLELVDDPVTGRTPRATGKTTSFPAVAADRIKLEVVDDPVTGPTPSVPGKTTSPPGAADSALASARPSRQSNRSSPGGASALGAARGSRSRRTQADGSASKSVPKSSGSASSSSRGSTGSRSSGASRTAAGARGASSRRGAASTNPKQGGSRSDTSAPNAAHERSGESRDGYQQDESRSPHAATIGLSVLIAAVGVAGGVLLGRTALQRQRKVLGIPLPSSVDLRLGGAGQKIGEAGHRFGKLADEVRSVRERAEKIGGALT